MRKLIGFAAVAVVLLLSLPAAAVASTPAQAVASGTLISHSQTPIRSADGNLTFSAVDIAVFSGGITGTVTDTYTFIVHPDGSITGHGVETCSSCTIAGRTGGYTETFNFTATPNFATFQGRFAVLSASGGLSGLHGEGTFQGAGFTETIVLNYVLTP